MNEVLYIVFLGHGILNRFPYIVHIGFVRIHREKIIISLLEYTDTIQLPDGLFLFPQVSLVWRTASLLENQLLHHSSFGLSLNSALVFLILFKISKILFVTFGLSIS